MRASPTVVLVAATALLLAGCSDDAPPVVEPTSQSPGPTATATPEGDGSPTTDPADEPTPSDEPTADVTDGPAAPEPPLTDLPASVLLAADALFPEDGPRTEGDGLVDWVLPPPCGVGEPGTAVAMQSASQGDGTFEVPVGHHQVAVFADAEAAVAEVDRVGTALAGCTGPGVDGASSSVVEPVDVGAQGLGLVVDYHGTFVTSGDEGALGYYTAMTRRGNAVTLVSSEGGESSIVASRERVVGELGLAWEQLCAYDSAGC